MLFRSRKSTNTKYPVIAGQPNHSRLSAGIIHKRHSRIGRRTRRTSAAPGEALPSERRCSVKDGGLRGAASQSRWLRYTILCNKRSVISRPACHTSTAGTMLPGLSQSRLWQSTGNRLGQPISCSFGGLRPGRNPNTDCPGLDRRCTTIPGLMLSMSGLTKR